MSIKQRLTVGAMTLSAAAFITLVMHEGYTDQAVIPTKNDRPTVGFGSTFHEDGSPVKLGDRTTPGNALKKAHAHISKDEQVFRDTMEGAVLNQAEYDLYLDWVYQYGIAAWDNSSMKREILAGNHSKACDALLRYKYSGGFDCSTPGNRICSGVWTRQLNRHNTCQNAQ